MWAGRAGILAAAMATGWFAVASLAAQGLGLPQIGAAAAFDLATQDGKRLALRDLRGKVVLLSFIFASCADSCPLLTAKLATLQSRLGNDFGTRVYFVSITVDPERDTPEALARYAQAHGANSRGWSFLTGTPAEILEVAQGYGVAYRKTAGGDVEHTFLTSVIDRRGILRVQYLGVRFDTDELLSDIRSLLREEISP